MVFVFHDTFFRFKKILQIFWSYRGSLEYLRINCCPEMGVIQIIKENYKEILCFKLKLRFLEIISQMNQFIFYLSGTGILCEMRQAFTWYGFNGKL